MKNFMVIAAALVLSAISADAGPIRNAVAAAFGGRCHGGHCQPQAGCGQSAPAQQCQPAPVQQPQTVYQTSYSGVGVPVDATPYQPIQLGSPLPVCPNGRCPTVVR